MTGRICIIIGTRPAAIKMAPVVRACERRGADYFVIHTGQHYPYNLDERLFDRERVSGKGYVRHCGHAFSLRSRDCTELIEGRMWRAIEAGEIKETLEGYK